MREMRHDNFVHLLGPSDGEILLKSKERMLWKQQVFTQLSISLFFSAAHRVKWHSPYLYLYIYIILYNYIYIYEKVCFLASLFVLLPRGQPKQQINSVFDIAFPSDHDMSHRFAANSQQFNDLQVLEREPIPHALCECWAIRAPATNREPLLCGRLEFCSAVEPWVFEACNLAPKIATLSHLAVSLFLLPAVPQGLLVLGSGEDGPHKLHRVISICIQNWSPFWWSSFSSIPWLCESDIWSGVYSVIYLILTRWFVETSSDC